MDFKMPIQGIGQLLFKKEDLWTNIVKVDINHVRYDATSTIGDAGELLCHKVESWNDTEVGGMLWDIRKIGKNSEFRLEMDEGGVYTFSGIVSWEGLASNSFHITISGNIQHVTDGM